MKKIPIGDFCEVMVGLVLKRKEADLAEENRHSYKALTLRSINPEGWIDDSLLDDFEGAEKLSERYLGKVGDVIIKLTPPYTAVAIDQSTSNCVIPSQLALIRCNPSEINPDYLAMFLNTGPVKKMISLGSTGITVPMVKTGTLREIEIPIPGMEKQRKIASIGKLVVQERHLMASLMEKKEGYYQALARALFMEEEE